MAFASYSLTPAQNLTLAGFSIAEGTTAPNSVNNCFRQIMADGKALSDQFAGLNLAGYAPLNAPVFTGQPTYQGRGAFLHHANGANGSGRIFILAEGDALPALINGDLLATY